MIHDNVMVLLLSSASNYCNTFYNNRKLFYKTENPPTPEINSKELISSVTGKPRGRVGPRRLMWKSTLCFILFFRYSHLQLCLGPRLLLQTWGRCQWKYRQAGVLTLPAVIKENHDTAFKEECWASYSLGLSKQIRKPMACTNCRHISTCHHGTGNGNEEPMS